MEEIKKMLPNVSSSPHFRSKLTTRGEMIDVCIAMIPIILWGAFHFGPYTLVITICTVAVAVASEYIYEKLMHLPITIGDFSAVVTGLILSMNMPPAIPVWVPMVGSVFAIIIVKQLYGGLGQNFINPAIAGRCFLHIAYSGLMNDFSYGSFDNLTSATPLAAVRAGESVNLWDLFIGNIPGTIGEVSKLCLLIGIAYMIWRNVITPRIPIVYIGTVAIFMFIAGGFDPYFMLVQLLSGGVVFGACFMANDYVTSPVTHKGQILYALFLGLMTCIIRLWSPTAEGVSYSILLGNLLVPILDRISVPEAFGKGGNKK